MKLRTRLRRLAQQTPRMALPSSARKRLTEPTDLAAAFAKAWHKRDAKAIADLFVEDADFVNVVGLWWRNRRAIRKAHQFGFDHAFAKAKVKVETVAVRRLGDDVAVIHAEWRMEGQLDPAGDEAGGRRGIISAVATRLEDGSWIGVSLQNTDIVHTADTNVSSNGKVSAVSYIQGPSKEVLAEIDSEAEAQRQALELG